MKKFVLFFSLLACSFAYSIETYNLYVPSGAQNIQWYKATSFSDTFAAITGATDTAYLATEPGIYYASFAANGCNNYSDYFVLVKKESELFFPLTLHSDSTAINTQWYDGDNAIGGETSSQYEVKTDGDYYAKTYSSDNCPNYSDKVIFREIPIPILADDSYRDTSYLETFNISGNVVTDDNFIGNENDYTAGDIDTIYILNSPAQGTIVSIDNEGNYVYSADESYIGTDSFTYVLCNTSDLCDTATVYVEIVKGTVIAVNDNFDDSNIGPIDENTHTISGNVVSNNDVLPADKEYTVTLYIDAKYGDLVLNEDGTFVYSAFDDLYYGLDSFAYIVCVGNVCDTAYVIIDIECNDRLSFDDITVPSLLSPNNDGNNEEWVIQELYDLRNCYTTNEVLIFNRWEVKVFHVKDYGRNNVWWDGGSDGWVAKGSEKLPVGTYYYIIKIDNDYDNAITGFIHIQY